MSRIELLPPPPEECLERRYPSSQKGGTLIAPTVTDLETHKQLLSDAEHYRPQCCPSCRHAVLHVHDYRERKLRGEFDRVVVQVLRYRCANPSCHAKWQILPQVIARHLHRSWLVVEAALKEERRPNRPRFPKQPRFPRRTMGRWKARLRSSARLLVSALAASSDRQWRALAAAVGQQASRAHLVESCRKGLGELAALVHRLVPGVRVM